MLAFWLVQAVYWRHRISELIVWPAPKHHTENTDCVSSMKIHQHMVLVTVRTRNRPRSGLAMEREKNRGRLKGKVPRICMRVKVPQACSKTSRTLVASPFTVNGFWMN